MLPIFTSRQCWRDASVINGLFVLMSLPAHFYLEITEEAALFHTPVEKKAWHCAVFLWHHLAGKGRLRFSTCTPMFRVHEVTTRAPIQCSDSSVSTSLCGTAYCCMDSLAAVQQSDILTLVIQCLLEGILSATPVSGRVYVAVLPWALQPASDALVQLLLLLSTSPWNSTLKEVFSKRSLLTHIGWAVIMPRIYIYIYIRSIVPRKLWSAYWVFEYAGLTAPHRWAWHALLMLRGPIFAAA